VAQARQEVLATDTRRTGKRRHGSSAATTGPYGGWTAHAERVVRVTEAMMEDVEPEVEHSGRKNGPAA
jgi:hypothetical protein